VDEHPDGEEARKVREDGHDEPDSADEREKPAEIYAARRYRMLAIERIV
jgi:hypothetical protein